MAMNPDDPAPQYPPPTGTDAQGEFPAGVPLPDAAYQEHDYYGEDGVGFAPMLHGDQLTDEYLHRQENRSGFASLMVAVLVHVGIFTALAFVIYSQVKNPLPEFVVAATQGMQDTEIQKKEFAQNVKQRPSAPSAKPSSLITSNVSSPVAVPSMDIITDDPSLGDSFGNGFGSGGFGDGFGGGAGIGVPATMKGRCNAADRAKRLREAGGEAKMDRAVVKGLRWLKDKQNDNGSWSTTFPSAMTGLALLAFSGHCETVDSPEFGECVLKAITYLVGQVDESGGLMASVNGRNISYEHAIACYALGEAYSLNKNARKPFPKISSALKDAMPIIIQGQTGQGGWLYGYETSGDGDLSVSGWNIQALKAAKLTGLHFSAMRGAMKDAAEYIEKTDAENGKYKYRLTPEHAEGRESLTGVGLLCARMLGDVSEHEDEGFKLIMANKPAPSQKRMDPYAWYYYSQAAFQRGGTIWRDYNASYQQVVMNTQADDGSWTPLGAPHTGGLGADLDIYGTALCTLMLEVYYRYLPATDGKSGSASDDFFDKD